MHLDFALILTVLTLASGLIWLVDRLFFARRRRERLAQGKADRDIEPKVVEYARSFFPVLLLVLLFRSFLFEPFKIPSGSMIPTLWIGDFILVNKYAYGLRLPVLNSKMLEVSDPKRGEVIVFRYPEDPRINYIKRVIGEPGDQVSYRNKVLYINGEPIEQESLGRWVGEGLNRNVPGTRPELLQELLADDPHEIVIYPESVERGLNRQSWEVPEGHYFVLGDNRDQSLDSRSFGFVPEENLVGRAVMIWMHWDCGRGCVDWRRIGDRIN